MNRALQSSSLLTPQFRGVTKEPAKELGETADFGATGSVAGGESSPSSGSALRALNRALQSTRARLFFIGCAGEVTEKQSVDLRATMAGSDGEGSASGVSARSAMNRARQSIFTRAPPLSPRFFVGCAGEEAERADLAGTANSADGERSASGGSALPPENAARQSMRSGALFLAAPRLFIGCVAGEATEDESAAALIDACSLGRGKPSARPSPTPALCSSKCSP